jgi:hypothetical protein
VRIVAGGDERASAFAALVAQQYAGSAAGGQEAGNPLAGGGIEGLAALGLDGEIASLRLALLKALQEIDDPFQRAIAVAKLAEAQARVQDAVRAAVPEGADALGRVLQEVLAELDTARTVDGT